MKIILTYIYSLFSLYSFSQNCDEIIKENQYLKETLNLISKNEFQVKDNLKFQVISITSNLINKNTKIEVLITNIGNDVREIRFNFDKNDVIDLQGNSYKIKSAKIGQTIQENINSYSLMSYTLNTDIPTKIIYEVEFVPNNVKKIKAVQIGFLGSRENNFPHYVVTCKNIDVDFIE